MRHRRGVPAIFLVAALLVLAPACAPSPHIVQVTVEAYISAVSLGDVGRLLDLSAPYQRELPAASGDEAVEALKKRYRGMIEDGFMQWDRAKSTGELTMDPLGIALIRGIGLGKEGAAAFPLGVRFLQGRKRAIVTTRAITNYEAIRWDRLPQGSRIYLLGVPFGKVINFAPGYDDPSQLELLATVDLEWTLVRMPEVGRTPGSPGDWFVEGVVPLPETATSWSPPPTDAP